MEKILLHLPYFGPVSHFREIVRPTAKIWFENEDNYQKQTFRNRTLIYGTNGELSLNIPIKHLHIPGVKHHQKYKDVKIENSVHWQKQHWKSLKSAYQTSPFFEFYEDELAPLYFQKAEFLMEFNYRCFDLICECMQLNIEYKKTAEYVKLPLEFKDQRSLIDAKTQLTLEEYPQVFQEKKGFLSNLSILDLVFNEGPNAVNYLNKLA